MSKPKKRPPGFKELCAIYGVDPSAVDARVQVMDAADAVDENRENRANKKRGRPSTWTGLRAAEFFINCELARDEFRKIHDRNPKKTELAEAVWKRHKKYGSVARVRTMLSDAHLRSIFKDEQKKQKFAEEFPAAGWVMARILERRKGNPGWKIIVKLFDALGHFEAFQKDLGWTRQQRTEAFGRAFDYFVEKITSDDPDNGGFSEFRHKMLSMMLPKESQDLLAEYLNSKESRSFK